MFVVISTSAIPDHLRGYITRFLIQADTGLFVGHTSRRVAVLLWQRCKEALSGGHATLICSVHDSEQGFEIQQLNPEGREIIDCDGVSLPLWAGQTDLESVDV